MEEIDNKAFEVPGGFVRLVDTMGNDAAVVQAARVSYGAGTKSVSDDASLIRYLMRHRHTSPFEMCEIKLHIRCPVYIARQWLRHRTANVNEASARYSIVDDEIHVPIPLRQQSSTNKQATEAELKGSVGLQYMMQDVMDDSFAAYKKLLDFGVCREQARVVLPVGMMTEFYWKIDIHNLLHFLRLRMHPHAQKEIRVFADAIAEIVKEWMPATWEAFEDYIIGAVTFNRREIKHLNGGDIELSKGEIRELDAKLELFDPVTSG